ncbi:MAG: peptidylprolyl isomerase [Planctomycetota bacterium]
MSSRKNIGRRGKRVNVRAHEGGALVLFCMLGSVAQRWEHAREPRATTQPESSRLQADAWFRHPDLGAGKGERLKLVQGLELSLGDYLDYVLARVGSAFVEDMVFDVLLERETRRRGLARKAVQEARSEAGRDIARTPLPAGLSRADHFVRLANQSLRRIRTRALVRADREATDAELSALFDQQYGVDGHRVEIRQILLSHTVTRRLLGDSRDVEAKTAERARAIVAKLERGSSFESLLAESDDPATQSLLLHPRYKSRAGIVEGYNYQRYGSAFAAAVRKLQVGEISAPVRTSHGYHIVQLLARKSTRFADVRPELVERFMNAPVSLLEERKLKEKLLRDHGIRVRR